MHLDADLREAIVTHHPETGPAWVDRLPDLVARCCERWSLTLRATVRPGGRASWAGYAELRDGTQVVLKIAVPGTHPEDLGAALRLYDPEAVVGLIAADPADRAVVMERCIPGDTAQSLTAEEGDDVAAGLLPRLWRPAPDVSIPTLAGSAVWMARALAERGECYGVGEFTDAAQLCAELATATEPTVLLHGDFHPPNVLLSGRGWLAIDPNPMIGERAGDVAVHLMHQAHLDADPVARVRRLATRVGVPPERALRWLAAYSAQWASWLRHSGATGAEFAQRITSTRRLLDAL